MNIFDIIGPVMIGPSSSHTAGAVRIGLIARALLNAAPIAAAIELHGSFAKTYKGHGTDKALVAGILGLKPDDDRIRTSLQLAEEQGLAVSLTTGIIDNAHPNTALITLTSASGQQATIQGASTGGGSILISSINGLEVAISGEYATLIVLHKDTPGTIATVTSYIGQSSVNIANFQLARRHKGGAAVMTIEIDGTAGEALNEHIKTLPNILQSTLLQPI